MIELLQLLEKYGYAISAQMSITSTPIEYAAIYGDIDAIRCLFAAYNVDPNVQTKTGCTILHLYIMSGYQKADKTDVLKILELGVDPSIRDIKNKSAYDYAVEQGYMEIANLFSEMGGQGVGFAAPSGEPPIDLE